MIRNAVQGPERSRIAAVSITDTQEIRNLVEMCRGFEDVEDEIINMIAESGALLRGWFHLLSGQHSTVFLRFSALTSSIANAERIAEIISPHIPDDGVTALISPETAGIILAYTIAKVRGYRRLVANTAHGHLVGIRSTKRVTPGDRILVVNDVVTAGSGMAQLLDLVKRGGGVVVGGVCFAIRDSGSRVSTWPAGLPLVSCVRLKVDAVTYGAPDRTADLRGCTTCADRPDAIYSGDIN